MAKKVEVPEVKMKFQAAKVIVINVLVTFVEGAVAAWALTGNRLDTTVLGGVIAAGLSSVWNLVVKPLLKANTDLYKGV